MKKRKKNQDKIIEPTTIGVEKEILYSEKNSSEETIIKTNNYQSLTDDEITHQTDNDHPIIDEMVTISENSIQNEKDKINLAKTIIFKENSFENNEDEEKTNSRNSIYLEKTEKQEESSLKILSDKDLEIMALDEIVIGYRDISEQEIANTKTKLDLASSYSSSKEIDNAKLLYEEIIEEGSVDQAKEAIEHLKTLIRQQ